jgi:hypothetical protein
MKTLPSIIFCFITFINCTPDEKDNDSSVCGVFNPIQNLSWLKDEIENGAYSTPSSIYDVYISTAIYKGQTILFTTICCPVCDVAPPKIKNCSGQSLGLLGLEIQESELTETKVIWRTQNGFCK